MNSVLIISGTTVLAVGLTSQLTAANSTGAPPPTSLTWQSRTPSVASVSPSGLVIATATGTATITVTGAGLTGTATITVQPLDSLTTTITACQAITTAGPYVLANDVVQTGSTQCLRLVGVAAVALDCRGHSVSSMLLSNANTVSITNCLIGAGPGLSAATPPLSMNNVSSVSVTGCTINGGSVGVGEEGVDVIDGTGVQFVEDTVSVSAAGASAAVYLQGGRNNQVLESTLVGGYDGGPGQTGTDDGVVLYNEIGDTVQGNSITNFWDTAIEGVDTVANAIVANNTVVNIGTAGIGAYWCGNWTGSVIRTNNVSSTPMLALIYYEVRTAKCGTSYPVAGFSGNQFIGNVFRNPIAGLRPNASARMSVDMSGDVSGNLLQGNDFGSSDGPELIPLAGFIDGGGNICGPVDPTISNFVCTGGGLVEALGFARPVGARSRRPLRR